MLRGHSLLFTHNGICEIKGLSTCCLVDIRYDHHLDLSLTTKSITSYLFDELMVSTFVIYTI